jgi:hypothetical protein
MKKQILPLLLIIFCISVLRSYSIPEKPQEIKAPITAVKVCLNLAQITHTQKIKIKPGINKLVFLGLSSNIVNRNYSLLNVGSGELLSLRLIRMSDTTNILSLQEDIFPMIGKGKDSIMLLEKNIERITYELKGLDMEKRMLEKGSEAMAAGSRSIALSELKQTNEYYRDRYRDVNLEILNKQRELYQLKKSKVKIFKSIFDVEGGEEGVMSINLMLAEIKNDAAEYSSDLALTYVAGQAGWIPIYDIYSNNNKSVKMNYRAKILNNTGLDWNNIKVTVTTADPLEYYSAPDLEPMIVNSRSDFRNNNNNNDYKKNLKNQIIEEEEILVPEREITFNLGKAYTFRTGLTPWFVDVTSFDLSPEYFYRSAPKKEEAVYSIARIKDWERLNLLDGEANLYNNGAFLGKTYLKPGEIDEQLELPLGIVDNIYIKHKLVKEYSSKKFFSGNTVASFDYEIKVKNISAEKVTVEVLDQVPVSGVSSVKTDLTEMTEGGEKEDATGKIVWKLEMNPSNEKILSLKYSISYPQRSYTFSQQYKARKIRAKF